MKKLRKAFDVQKVTIDENVLIKKLLQIMKFYQKVVLKVLKHSKETLTNNKTETGYLLGAYMENEKTVEITNCFPTLETSEEVKKILIALSKI